MRKLALAALCLVACAAGDDTKEGSRGSCEFGGTLTMCPQAQRTPQDACWRLVDCGAIPLHDDGDQNSRDWDNCVDEIGSYTEERRDLIMSCIAISTCDELRAGHCIRFGAPR